MNLQETPVEKKWHPTHFVYVEKIGPFQQTAQAAWQHLHTLTEDLGQQCAIRGAMALYKIQPEMVYRAGMIVDQKPAKLKEGLRYVEFAGGNYACFILTGSYAQLPEACGRVFEIVAKTSLPVRDDFFIEHYVNNPKTTATEDLITEILIPTK